MRSLHFSVSTLSGLSIASPVLTKHGDAVSLLTDLYTTVQTYTGTINQSLHFFLALKLETLDATLASLSASSPLLEKTAVTAQVGAQINLITAAVTATTNEIKLLPPSNSTSTKRPIGTGHELSAEGTRVESQPEEKRQLITVGALLAPIIVEIVAIVTAAVAILVLAGLLIPLNPLTTGLSLLIIAVELVLNAVLLGVIAGLDSLLTALALGVSGS